MKKQVAIRLPKLYDAGGDTSKKWFVYFHTINPKTKKLERSRIQRNINQFDNRDDRYKAADELIEELAEKLKRGWNPIDEESNKEVIYYDSLAYEPIKAINQGKKTSKSKNVCYYLSEYTNLMISRYTGTTYKTYQSKLRTFSLWLEKNGYGEYDVSAISNSTVVDFFLHLIGDRGLAKCSIVKYEQQLAGFFEWLVNDKKIYESPIYNIPTTDKEVDLAPRPIPERYMDDLKREIENDIQLSIATKLEFYSAIRPKEIRHLKIKDIDLSSGIIRISSTFGKNNKVQSVAMPRQLIDAITRTYNLEDIDSEFYLLGKYGEPGPQMVGVNSLRERFNRIRNKLKLPFEYKLYSFKHTAAVKLVKDKKDIKFIQTHFRHEHLDTTDKYMRKIAAYDTDMMKDNFPDL